MPLKASDSTGGETSLFNGKGLTNGLASQVDPRPSMGTSPRSGPPSGSLDLVASDACVNGRPGSEGEDEGPRPIRKLRVVKALGAPGDNVASGGSGLTRGPAVEGRESLTTGAPSVNGKGLTSGWGMVNGTGMTREPGHHRRGGRFNGSGSRVSTSLAGGEGMTNGNGLTHGGETAAGTGMTNGCGLTHGTGMTNGCGLVQEPSAVPVPQDGQAPRRRRILGLLPF